AKIGKVVRKVTGPPWRTLVFLDVEFARATRILMATSRLSLLSRARYTSPIPPLPRTAIISSEPSRVPTSTDIGISVEMQIAFGGLCREATTEANLGELSTQVMGPEQFPWSHDARAASHAW